MYEKKVASRDTTLYTKSLSEEVLTELERNKNFELDHVTLECRRISGETERPGSVRCPVSQAKDVLAGVTVPKADKKGEEEKENDTAAAEEEHEHELEESDSQVAQTDAVCKTRPCAVIEQQKRLIGLEALEFKDGGEAALTFDDEATVNSSGGLALIATGGATAGATDDDEATSAALQAALRRQSLFKLREKINGKVSRHVNEIEKRKLSPYRFSHSPLKQPRKLFKVLRFFAPFYSLHVLFHLNLYFMRFAFVYFKFPLTLNDNSF